MFEIFDDVSNALFEGADALLTGVQDLFKDAPLPDAAPDASPAPEISPAVEDTPMDSAKGIIDSTSPPATDSGMLKEIQSQYAKGEESFRKWLDGMKPEDRKVVGLAIAGGAKAMLEKASQEDRQKFQKELLDRVAEDKKRRGQVAAMAPGAVTAKPLAGGLINSMG